MPKVVVRGEAVYQCTVCNRKLRVPTNTRGLDVLVYCTITAGCKGKLTRVTQAKEINNTPALTPSIVGLNDWFQRKVLYTHTQAVASNIWNIRHNLGGRPIIHTFLNQQVNGQTELVPSPQPIIEYIDANTIQVLFDKAETGVVQLITLSSQNTTNPMITESTAIVDNIQWSTNTGLLTIGTLDDTLLVNILITYVLADQTFVTIQYVNIDDTPAASSPWAGVNKVFVNGRTYTVRSIDLINHPNAVTYFLTGQIPPQGCPFYVNTVNGVAPTHGSLISLGATTPFAAIDRIYNQIVDLGDETITSAGILYSFGKVFAIPNVIDPVYPHITVV